MTDTEKLTEVRKILKECENDFHACARCDNQDDQATKTSNLYLLLKDIIGQ